jgi:hypothetical protein
MNEDSRQPGSPLTPDEIRAARVEFERAGNVVHRAMRMVVETDGDPEIFMAFMLRAVIEANFRFHEPEAMERAVAGIGVELRSGNGQAGRA